MGKGILLKVLDLRGGDQAARVEKDCLRDPLRPKGGRPGPRMVPAVAVVVV